MTRRPKKRERRADVDPEPIGSALERYSNAAKLGEGLALARMRDRWTDIVGPILGPRCRPERITEDGMLTVFCDHGVTANEVSMLYTVITERATEIGRVHVARLDVKVRKPRSR